MLIAASMFELRMFSPKLAVLHVAIWMGNSSGKVWQNLSCDPSGKSWIGEVTVWESTGRTPLNSKPPNHHRPKTTKPNHYVILCYSSWGISGMFPSVLLIFWWMDRVFKNFGGEETV